MRVTFSLSRRLVERARRYARARGQSLNALVRVELERSVARDRAALLADLEELWAASGRSPGRLWTRDEIYDRKVLVRRH